MTKEKRGITYRLFCEDDYNQIAHIIGNQWFNNYSKDDRDLLGAAEFDMHLSNANRGLVAEMSGKVVGVSLCRWGDVQDTKERLAHMKRLADEHKDHLDIASEMTIAIEEHNLMNRIADELGSEGVGFLELLIVSPDAQGLGVGGELLRRNLTWLKDQGATSYRLATDDACDWQFYEYKGLKRKGETISSITKAHKNEEPFRLYIYEGTL